MASDDVSEEAVYTCTGNPLPRDIQQIVEWIMNQSFAEAFASMSFNYPNTHWACP